MVTVNFAKAQTITHALRQALHVEKTREHYQQMSNMLARLEFMADGDDKTALRAEAEAIKALVDACIAEDVQIAAEIEAVTTDDIGALEAVHISIERKLNAVYSGATTY